MHYFVQTSVPNERNLFKGLQSIYGLGETTCISRCQLLGLNLDARGRDLRRFHVFKLKTRFKKFPTTLGEDLKIIYKNACQRLIDIRCYKGKRHFIGFPVRGQRRHTNAQTQKRLHKRWIINTFEKPKVFIKAKKTNIKIKLKKPKVVAKKTNKTKPVQKTKDSKYKV